MAVKNVKTPYSFNLPWFILDLDNYQLITSENIPSDLSDTKDVILSETPIPGLNYAPIQYNGGGNRKISFTLPLIKRNNSVGNVLIAKQFDSLRNQAGGLKSLLKKKLQFMPNPKVVYYWGTTSVPLEYYVKKCDFNHKSAFVNQYGFTQYSEISMELWLDEESALYEVEEVFRKLGSFGGVVQQAFERYG